MQTIRYNLYTFIHKGIRRELCELLRIAGNLDFSDVEESGRFVRRLRNSLRLMNDHAHHEDEVIDPHLAEFAPKLARRIAATHKVLESEEGSLYALCEDACGDSAAGHNLYLALTRYVATQYAHMSEEETDVIQALWEHMSDDEVFGCEHAIVGHISPQDNAVYLTWMIHAMNASERETFLNALRKGAPPEAVAFAEEQVRAATEAQLTVV